MHSFVAIDRELLVEEHQLSEQLGLLDLFVGDGPLPPQGIFFDAIDFGFHAGNRGESRRRKTVLTYPAPTARGLPHA
jgi:hypothetical protein